MGDSTVDFWLYALRACPSCMRDLPYQGTAALRYALKRSSKEAFKEAFYRFLKRLEDPLELVESFWTVSLDKMNEEVLTHARKGDLVVSASPRFLLEAPCAKFGLALIASEGDPSTGQLLSPNCHGEEKVRRIVEEDFPLQYEKGFSDSLSDAPMLALAEKPFLVTLKGVHPIEMHQGNHRNPRSKSAT